MISVKEKGKMWQRVSKEFPSDAMLRDLHFIRELMSRIKDKLREPRNYQEIGLIARREFAEWLKTHPELSDE